ncbi:hypothetical protein D4764_19G0002710, partial [Takifugu flavidus]
AELPSPASKPLHDIVPGDWIMVKVLSTRKRNGWKGPHQVLQASHTSVMIAEGATWLDTSQFKSLLNNSSSRPGSWRGTLLLMGGLGKGERGEEEERERRGEERKERKRKRKRKRRGEERRGRKRREERKRKLRGGEGEGGRGRGRGEERRGEESRRRGEERRGERTNHDPVG